MRITHMYVAFGKMVGSEVGSISSNRYIYAQNLIEYYPVNLSMGIQICGLQAIYP